MARSLLDYAATVESKRLSSIVETFARSSVILERLRMIDLDGAESYRYNVEASIGGATWRALGQDITADNGVVNPAIENPAILSRLVEMDRQRRKKPEYRSGRLLMGSKACAAEFTKAFFDGDPASDPNQMRGINARIGTSAAHFRAIDENGSDANGGYLNLSIDLLDEMIRYVKGRPEEKMILMDGKDQDLLGAALRLLGSDNIVQVQTDGGARVSRLTTHYNNVEIGIIEDDAAGNQILGKDETRGSDNTTSSIYCVWFGSTEGEGLMGLHDEEGTFEVEDRPGTATQDHTLIEGKVGMANFHPRAIARLSGIKSTNYSS